MPHFASAFALLSIDDFEKFTNGIEHIVQVLALLVGGLWAYFKFFRGRTFKRRLDLSVEATLLRLATDDVAQVTVRLRNIGLSKVNLTIGAKEDRRTPGLSKVAVYWCPSGIWPVEHDQWPRLTSYPLFPDQLALESGEMIAEELMIPLPADPDMGFPLAYEIRAEVWSTRSSMEDTPAAEIKTAAATKQGAEDIGLQIWSVNLVIPVELRPVGETVRSQASD